MIWMEKAVIPITLGVLMALMTIVGFVARGAIDDYQCRERTGGFTCSMQADKSAFTPKRGVQI